MPLKNPTKRNIKQRTLEKMFFAKVITCRDSCKQKCSRQICFKFLDIHYHPIALSIEHSDGTIRKYKVQVIQKVHSSCKAGEGSLKSELKRTGGAGRSSLFVRSLCEKHCLIFKQQPEFFLISCLAGAKCFLF